MGWGTGTAASEGAPVWQKYTVTYTDFSAASTSNNILIAALAAGARVHAVAVDVTEAFSIPGFSYTLSVGVTGDLTKFADAHDVTLVHQEDDDYTYPAIQNWTAASGIRAEAIGSANLDQATAGSADIYILVSQVTS